MQLGQTFVTTLSNDFGEKVEVAGCYRCFVSFCWGIKLMYIYSSQTSYISLDINYTYNRLLVHVKLYTPGRLYKINCCFLGPYLTIHYAPLSLLLVELLMTFYQISNSQTVHQNLSQLIYTNITYFSFHKLPNLLSL